MENFGKGGYTILDFTKVGKVFYEGSGDLVEPYVGFNGMTGNPLDPLRGTVSGISELITNKAVYIAIPVKVFEGSLPYTDNGYLCGFATVKCDDERVVLSITYNVSNVTYITTISISLSLRDLDQVIIYSKIVGE